MKEEGLDAFKVLSSILTAWGTASEDVVENFSASIKADDATAFATHSAKLTDSDVLLFLGYVSRLSQKSGTRAMQSTMVNNLVPNDHPSLERERNKLRQDLKRRADSCEYFGLLKRTYLSPVAVEFEITEKGEELLKKFNALVIKETVQWVD